MCLLCLVWSFLPPLPVWCTCATLACSHPVLLSPTLWLLSQCFLHPLLFLAVVLHLQLPPRTSSEFFNGMLVIIELKALNSSTLSSSILQIFVCTQESNLNLSFSFGIPGYSALGSDRTHSPLAFFLQMATCQHWHHYFC